MRRTRGRVSLECSAEGSKPSQGKGAGALGATAAVGESVGKARTLWAQVVVGDGLRPLQPTAPPLLNQALSELETGLACQG